MAVLVLAEIPGTTAEDGKQWEPMVERMRRAPGFLVHVDGPVETGWRLVEVWEKREDFKRWYDSAIKPNLPPGTPNRDRIYELANVVFAE